MATARAARQLHGLVGTITAQVAPQHHLARPFVCQQCRRSLSTTRPALAGHNKWSKTKHIKAVTDKKKTAERTNASNLIALYSRLYGDDVQFNPQLANAIAAATKASVPKHVIDNAIARGQGRSATGAQLEPMTLEFLFPPDVAIVIEAETDNKNRSLQDLRSVVKKGGGVVGSTAFYFTRRGRAVFSSSPKEGATVPSLSDLLEEAIEYEGTEDVEELPDGDYVVWTQPAMLAAVTQGLAKKLDLEILESDIVWSPNEDTKVAIGSEELIEALESTFAGLRDYTEVKGLYANMRQGSMTDDQWERIARHLDL
ncbi:transcriptional regulator domain-containing protein [Sarocladium implicatum]|nr:transcriptional regulator domain-containing protein [Sarocladium implicatum]